MGEYTDLSHDKTQEQEEEEEALSLCDFPLNDNKKETANTSSQQTRRSSSEPPEFFEFFSDLSSEMCSADDIFFCGKLIPFKGQYLSPPIQTHKTHINEDKKHISFRRRSESLSGLHTSVTRSNSAKNKGLMRNSRSLDYRKLERHSSSQKASPASDIDRNSSAKSVGKGDVIVKKAPTKPRWYLLMFGVVKPPTEMELRDIKNRQVRRNPSMTMFPPVVETNGKKSLVNRSSISKGSCRLLRVLSCKDPATVAVTTSFCMPQV